MSRIAVAEARRAWRAAVLARGRAEGALVRAEEQAEKAYGDDQWDELCTVHTAHARLEKAKDQENAAEDEYLRLLPERGSHASGE
jgi:hypothetical protein